MNKLLSGKLVRRPEEIINPKFRLVLTLSMILATYQLFVPFLVTYLPLALIFSLICIMYIRIYDEDKFILFFTFLYFINVLVSFQWSVDKGAWISNLIYGFLFFIGYFSANSYKHSADSNNSLNRILYFFLIFASINAILVIIFRLIPEIESNFWSSGLMNLFKSPKRLANIDFFKPNVFDLNKSGGVFDNANTGATFNLLCLGATIALKRYLSKKMFFALLLLFSLAVISSGSKSALLIFLILCFFSILSILPNRNNAIIKLFLGYLLFWFFATLIFFWDQIVSYVGSSSFMADSLRTMTYRNILWDIAVQQIKKHPYFGLGFGGWVQAIAPYKMMLSGQLLPPHNSLINAWINTGFIAPFSILVVWLTCFSKLLVSFLKKPSNIQVGALFALISVAAMSMGDTFPIFGNPNIAFPLGFLVAYGLPKVIKY